MRDPAEHQLGDAATTRFDFTRPETFPSAVAGASGLLLVRPPAISDVRPTLCALVDAALAAGLRRVVFLSVLGAERRGYIPHAKVERHLRESRAEWTMLRAGFFSQNLGDVYRSDIRDRSELRVPAGAGRAAFVDVRDLGEAAARCFTEEGHEGRAYPLTGPEAVAFADVAALLSAELGRKIRYRRASVLGYAAHLRRQGLPWGQLAVQTILHVGLRFGQAEQVDPTLPRLLGRPAGTLARYISDHRDLWVRP